MQVLPWSGRRRWLAASVVALGTLGVVAGCYNTPVETSDLAKGPAPLERRPAATPADGPVSEDPDILAADGRAKTPGAQAGAGAADATRQCREALRAFGLTAKS